MQAAEGPPDARRQVARMQRGQRLIATVAPTDSTVLILGETGTGKELVARSLHDKSQRRRACPSCRSTAAPCRRTWSRASCSAIARGRSPAPTTDHKGLFEVANGGTLFLDEVGELNKTIQVKLLRFLESRRDPPRGRDRAVPRRRAGAVRHQPRPARR